MHPFLNMAIRAARRAGDIISRHTTRLDRVQVTSKSANDFVSNVDREAEAAIIEILAKAYPDHAFMGEESGESGKAECTWIIDPLDGTTNFLHGFPAYSVSIALRQGDKIEHAVVYDPTREELFTASRGKGAYLDDRRIRVSNRNSIKGALLGTGFPFKRQQDLDAYLEMFKALFTDTAGIRRAGSAALDLSYVAAGRLDGFWEIGLKPWDMAAGTLLVQEAGGIISDFDGNDQFMETGNVVSGPIKVHQEILRRIAPYAQQLNR